MDEQIQNFKKTIEDLSLILGNKTRDFLGRSLFFISMGANDYINNYLHPLALRYKKYPIAAYEQLLIQEYSRQIKVVCISDLCLLLLYIYKNEPYDLVNVDIRISMILGREKSSCPEFLHLGAYLTK